jgi:uncharacterized membrane protein (UPF0127 family)
MRILIAIACLTVAACSPQPAAKQGTVRELDGAFEFTTLEIINEAGEQLVFDVYLAQDFEQQRRGLMFVRSMPERTGMLFIYETEGIRSMWMKNTYIPLDMVFARSDGSVSSVIHRAEPHTLVSRASIEPVRYVLELNAGTARRLDIGSRSRIIPHR